MSKNTHFNCFIGHAVVFTYYGVPHHAIFDRVTQHVTDERLIDLEFSSVTRNNQKEEVASQMTVSASQHCRRVASQKSTKFIFETVEGYFEQSFVFIAS